MMQWILRFLGILAFSLSANESSYHHFLEVLRETPCDPEALRGLAEIGQQWSQDEEKQEEEVVIYEAINRCEPNNPDTLFYLGRALAKTGRWKEAEKVLKECLEVAPQYSDAEIQLGFLYLWQGKWKRAEELFAKYPENHDAKLGLAMAVRRQGREGEAKEHLQTILSENPHRRDVRREHANLLASEMDYSGAEAEFTYLVDDDPNPSPYWANLFDVKSHTRYGFLIEAFYTEVKEDDPSLGVPVVKNYYFFNALHLIVPATNRWRLDLEEIYYHQRENDIFMPLAVNYSMYLSGGQITSSYFFARHWRWDVTARAFHAWGQRHNVHYPFQSTTRFEPGTGVLYNSERQLFSFDVHTESFVIKNFARVNSNLLRTDFLTVGYAYRFPWKLHPEVEAWVSHVFIRDSLKNWRNTEQASARCGVPFCSKYLMAIYRFEHGHYDQLSENYYSFKQQLRNVLGVRLHVPISSSVSWDTEYLHRWQTTYNLFLPIGDFVFVAPKQYLVANWVTSALSARYRDQLRLALEGHYFHDTLPYRDWNLTGSLLYQF